MLTGLFAHETNTFSQLPTTLSNYQDFVLAFDENVPAAIAGSMLELNGVIQVADEKNWDLIHTVAAWATPSGPVAHEVWETCAGKIRSGPVSGAV